MREIKKRERERAWVRKKMEREGGNHRWERRGRGRRLMEKCPKSDLSKVNKEFKGWD